MEHVEAALDPSIEISKLLEAKQYEAAITKVLTLADTAFLSWFCLQVCPLRPPYPISLGRSTCGSVTELCCTFRHWCTSLRVGELVLHL